MRNIIRKIGVIISAVEGLGIGLVGSLLLEVWIGAGTLIKDITLAVTIASVLAVVILRAIKMRLEAAHGRRRQEDS